MPRFKTLSFLLWIWIFPSIFRRKFKFSSQKSGNRRRQKLFPFCSVPFSIGFIKRCKCEKKLTSQPNKTFPATGPCARVTRKLPARWRLMYLFRSQPILGFSFLSVDGACCTSSLSKACPLLIFSAGRWRMYAVSLFIFSGVRSAEISMVLKLLCMYRSDSRV